MLLKPQLLRRLPLVLLALLLVPLIAMRFTEAVHWQLGDFLVMGSLLVGLGFLLQHLLARVEKPRLRLLLVCALLLVFGLVWAELAVGILGTPFAGN